MRSLAALITALVVSSAAAAAAQTPPPSQPPPSQPSPSQPAPSQPAPAQPAAQPAGRVFGSDAGVIFNQVKPDKTADFEAAIAKIKEALLKATDPVRKQQAASWKVFKAQEPGPNGNVFYLFVIDPAVKGADYSIGKILSEGLPAAEVQDVWKKYTDSLAAGQNVLNLSVIANFGAP
jgi:pyruvate/2-oxoglutarate dehydrogenase complex dihydrolipoamide acyltransferase (E2) component